MVNEQPASQACSQAVPGSWVTRGEGPAFWGRSVQFRGCVGNEEEELSCSHLSPPRGSERGSCHPSGICGPGESVRGLTGRSR